MKEIKLTIDGREVKLTKEQIKALGIEVDDGCVCDMVDDGERYFYIDALGHVFAMIDTNKVINCKHYTFGNYYRDESYAKQVAMHQMLNNLLRRYSEQRGGEAEWDAEHRHYRIAKDMISNSFYVEIMCWGKCDVVYFCSKEAAEDAIKEVVKPFMEEHPDFVW